MASTSGQVLDGIVGENEEVEDELVDVEALMIEGHDGILARDNRGTEGMGSGSGNGSGRGSEESQSRSETGESRETPANRDLTPESSAAQRLDAHPRGALPSGARLRAPSVAPACSAAGVSSDSHDLAQFVTEFRIKQSLMSLVKQSGD